MLLKDFKEPLPSFELIYFRNFLRLIARIISSFQAFFILSYVFSYGTKSQISLNNCMLLMFKKPQNFKGLTVNLVIGLFKQCSRVQMFLLFSKTNLYGRCSYILWNKFQDYQLRFF